MYNVVKMEDTTMEKKVVFSKRERKNKRNEKEKVFWVGRKEKKTNEKETRKKEKRAETTMIIF